MECFDFGISSLTIYGSPVTCEKTVIAVIWRVQQTALAEKVENGGAFLGSKCAYFQFYTLHT